MSLEHSDNFGKCHSLKHSDLQVNLNYNLYVRSRKKPCFQANHFDTS